MTGFVPENTHAPFHVAAFDLEHLIQFQFGQARMGQIKRNGDSGHAIGRKPFLREPKMRSETQPSFVQLSIQLRDTLFKGTAFELEMEIAETKIEELFVTPCRPLRMRADTGRCGRRRTATCELIRNHQCRSTCMMRSVFAPTSIAKKCT